MRSSGGARAIWRVSESGRKVERLVDGKSVKTPIARDNLLAVLRDGTMIVYGPTASSRIFTPDGNLRDASLGARMGDAKHKHEDGE